MELVPTPQEAAAKIITLPGREKTMLDRDVAEFYGVTTKHLNQQTLVRNPGKFSDERFIFKPTTEELPSVRQQAQAARKETVKFTYVPNLYTQAGVLLCATVFQTPQALAVAQALSAGYAGQAEAPKAEAASPVNNERPSADTVALATHLKATRDCYEHVHMLDCWTPSAALDIIDQWCKDNGTRPPKPLYEALLTANQESASEDPPTPTPIPTPTEQVHKEQPVTAAELAKWLGIYSIRKPDQRQRKGHARYVDFLLRLSGAHGNPLAGALVTSGDKKVWRSYPEATYTVLTDFFGSPCPWHWPNFFTPGQCPEVFNATGNSEATEILFRTVFMEEGAPIKPWWVMIGEPSALQVSEASQRSRRLVPVRAYGDEFADVCTNGEDEGAYLVWAAAREDAVVKLYDFLIDEAPTHKVKRFEKTWRSVLSSE